MKKTIGIWLALVFIFVGVLQAEEIIYEDAPNAKSVVVAGSWNEWGGSAAGNLDLTKNRMTKDANGVWHYTMPALQPGVYEYKFIIDGQWENGSNRELLLGGNEMSKKEYIFRSAPKAGMVSIAGDWNGWAGSSAGNFQPEKFKLEKAEGGLWQYKVKDVIPPGKHEYKFIVDGKWDGGKNKIVYIDKNGLIYKPVIYFKRAQIDSFNSITLELKHALKKDISKLKFSLDNGAKIKNAVLVDSPLLSNRIIRLTTTKLDLSKRYTLSVEGLSPGKTISQKIIPGKVLGALYSFKEAGALVNKKKKTTTFRIFAPRANGVKLFLYDAANSSSPTANFELTKDSNGMWEYTYPDVLYGKYYKYSISGQNGPGDGFDPSFLVSDPYAFANVQNDGKSIVFDMTSTNSVFKGWQDKDFTTPKMSDLIIMELSVRDLSSKASSKVEKKNQKKYLGLLEGEPIKEIINSGINAVELMPIHEFDDKPYGVYHWGYMTSLFFTPESTYAHDPEHGSQVYELKELVNQLHKKGIAVIMDVVYNHVGEPNYYRKIDNFLYFRMDDNQTYTNSSGTGNDFKTENAMVRKLIIDSLKHFVTYYHIDGFRFDLAGMIDSTTRKDIKTELTKLNKNIILIAEPWAAAPGYYILPEIKGTGWSAWNDKFRNSVKEYVRYGKDKAGLIPAVKGYPGLFTTPAQSINYLASHDDYSLIDEITTRPDHNGKFASETDKKENMIGALITFTSLGVPMITEGQDFLRSKSGIKNTYNSGDEVNGIDWNLKYKNADVYDFYSGLMKLRLSKAGAIFRNAEPTADYVKILNIKNRKAFGYIVNADESVDGPTAIVLINMNKSINVSFKIPAAKYRVISEKYTVNTDGIRTIRASSIKLATLSCMILFKK